MSDVAGGEPRQPKAIVFDLDGTLADTRDDIVAACNYARTTLGKQRLPASQIVSYIGDGGLVLVARAFGLPVSDETVQRGYELFLTFYLAHPADHARWMPGAREALDACGDIPLALATNKMREATLPLMAELDMTRRFQVIVAGGDGPLKPDPAAISAAVSPLGVHPRDAWMVGDGPQDVGAGQAAGAYTVGVLGGFAEASALRAAKPHRLLGSLYELPALLALVR